MWVRVYQPAFGPCRVLRPNPRTRGTKESAQAHVARVAPDVEQADLSLCGLPWVDLDEADLPPRTDRARWRLRDGAVVVDRSGAA